MAKGGVAPYTYQWEGRSETLPALEQLCRGTYTLTVTDAAGCSFSQSFSMTPPDLLQLNTVSVKAPTCFQGCDGKAQVTVQGGTAPYRYQWSEPHTDNTLSQTTAQADGLCPGSYTVTVTDAQGCSEQQQVTIQQTPAISLQLPDTVNLCLDQQVTLDATVPMGQYQWTHNGIAYSKKASIITDKAGTYHVSVTNAQGCMETASTRVNTYDTLFEVNFLQSSEAYTGDTLTLSEICYPQPDSVQWRYSQGIQMLDLLLLSRRSLINRQAPTR